MMTETSFNPGGSDRVNLFSLVTYIPDPLGSFLDRLRQELVPSCLLRAHVTVLPPRPLPIEPGAAWTQICRRLAEFAPFNVCAGDVEIFSVSSVIYLAVKEGFAELCRLHEQLNTDSLAYGEPFPYHPHITLAQQLAPEQIEGVYELARRRWAEFPHPRCFRVDRLTFVQGTVSNSWVDLAECCLGGRP